MDISQYKERFKKGENIDFPISIEKMSFAFFICLIFAVFSVYLLLSSLSSGIEDYRKYRTIITIASSPFFCYLTLRLGKGLFSKRQPQLFSVNKDSLVIYDKTMPSLLSNKNSCIIIPWKEILGLEIAGQYLVLECNPFTIQNIEEHQKQVSVKMFRSYGVVHGILMLNAKILRDMSLEDVLNLLQEFHKEATAKPQ